MKRYRFLFATALVSLGILVQAQSFEIRAVDNGNGFIGVQMRSTSGNPPSAGNYVTDMVFGLKWSAAYGVDLANATTNYNIVKSGTRQQKSNFHFQAFSAANTPFNFPAAWTLNNWVEIMSIRNTMTGRGLGTFEIAEKGFDPTTDPNLGVDLVDYTPVINGSATNVPLPINLIRFEAKPTNRMIRIEWVTASEQNNKGFEVHRSQKESDGYKTIGWVESKGNGNAKAEYIFDDEQVAAKVKYYYRLKQIDADGSFHFSEVRAGVVKENTERIRIAPNPVDDIVRMYFGDELQGGEAVAVKVVDAKGAVVAKKHTAGGGNKVELNVSGLSRGQYFLTVEKDGHLLYSKVFQKR